MKKVIYTGNADYQSFSAEDFAKICIEDQGGVEFTRGEPTEVSDSAAGALTANEGLFAGHSFELAPDGVEEPESEDDESRVMLRAGEGEYEDPAVEAPRPGALADYELGISTEDSGQGEDPADPTDAGEVEPPAATEGDEATTEGTATPAPKAKKKTSKSST